MQLIIDKSWRLITICCGILTILVLIFFTGFAASEQVGDIEFIGQDILPTGTIFQNTEVGGLSGITYDATNDVYYGISDDQGRKAPARFYTFKINLSQGQLKKGGISILKVTTLSNENGTIFPPGITDTEGIALTNRNSLFIASEGNVKQLIDPFIPEISLNSGKAINKLPIPPKFLPDKDQQQGIRNNLGFESLTITPDQKTLFTATENALIQDGTSTKPGTGTRCRILQYDLFSNGYTQPRYRPAKEFLYETEPITPILNISGKFASGLTDLLALDNQGNFLSLERSFNGWGFTVLLFHTSLKNASEIQGIDSLLAFDQQKIKPVGKKLLLNLQKVNIAVDNIEGLSLGPILPDGHPTLILVSDNNFNQLQRTQILAFKLKPDFVTATENASPVQL